MHNQIVKRIRNLRTEKGFSRKEMADKLNVDLSVYSRLETGETYTWAKYFEELLNIFEIEADAFFEKIGSNITITNKKGSFGGNITVENLHAENKETTEKLITHLKEEILFLRKQLSKDN